MAIPPHRPVLLAALVLMPLAACAKRIRRTTIPREEATPDRVQELIRIPGAPDASLKAHMMDGTVYVLLGPNSVDHRGDIEGRGVHLGVNRETLEEGPLVVPMDSVALFESNTLVSSPSVMGMAVVTGVSVAITVYCIANPKACFGSCPTFYADPDGQPVLRAEGFSASIAPSLEDTDVDALVGVAARGPLLELEMRNEALETHVIRQADLLVVERPEGGRVFRDGAGRFWGVTDLRAPTACRGGGEECLAGVRARDGSEYFSLADSMDLGAQEVLELVFPTRMEGERLGLVVTARQSLLPTYLLYQAFAFMGREAGAWLARLEREETSPQGVALPSVFDAMDIEVRDEEGEWRLVGQVGEHGPLAPDVHLLPLPESASKGPVKVRIRLTQGAWRLDQVALAVLDGARVPERITPHAVLSAGNESTSALAALTDESRSLTTLPGDRYRLRYRLPEATGDREVFLETRGYYLEWMREEWLAEENPARLAMLLFNPEAALRQLAPEYKKVEAEMERAFWGSRYARRH